MYKNLLPALRHLHAVHKRGDFLGNRLGMECRIPTDQTVRMHPPRHRIASSRLPEPERLAVNTILSDNGCEFCGRPDHHPYELFATGRDRTSHDTRTTASEQRLHRATTPHLAGRALRVKGRTTWYESGEQMQADLDEYLRYYNHDRAHQGRMMEGRTPLTMFLEGLAKRPKREILRPYKQHRLGAGVR